MAEKYGITKVSKIIKASLRVLVVLAPAIKKGWTAADLMASLAKIEADPECHADLQDALADTDSVNLEITDISTTEFVLLCLEVAKGIPPVVKAFLAKDDAA